MSFQILRVPVVVRAVIGLLLMVGLIGFVTSLAPAPAGASTGASTGASIVSFAASQAGVAYCDGGGGINGPSHGNVEESGCEGNTPGFDCMSLAQYAVYQATGIVLPSNGSQPNGVGTVIPPDGTTAASYASDLQPGDVTFWGGTLDNFSHSGVYAGNGEVWDAVGVNIPVQEHTLTQLMTTYNYNYDGAIQYWSSSAGSPPALSAGGLPGPVTAVAATPNGGGYWLTNAAGGVSPHGTAVSHGSMSGTALRAPIVGMASTPSGNGYWLVASDGGVFAFGDANFYGSMGGKRLNAPVVDMAPTKDGLGYWLVASDGGIFTFGDATFQGSMGGQRLNKPVVAMAADQQSGGYWEVASDGGIFSFGAPFFGSSGNIALNKPVVGMAPAANNGGYWLVASDGGIFTYGSSTFQGSMGATTLNKPIVGMAADSASGGYWLVGSDGGIFSFTAPFDGAD
jgi:hypothetical protein